MKRRPIKTDNDSYVLCGAMVIMSHCPILIWQIGGIENGI